MPFCVATCPACPKPFRLRWRIGKRKLELSQLIRLNCSHCRNQFEIEGVELVIFDAGAESFPVTAMWMSPALFRGSSKVVPTYCAPSEVPRFSFDPAACH